MPTIYGEVLRRASQIVGDENLARLLGVTPTQLSLWKATGQLLPEQAFLKAVDIIFQHQLLDAPNRKQQ